MRRTANLVLFLALGVFMTACAPTEQAVDPNDIRERYDAYNAAVFAVIDA